MSTKDMYSITVLNWEKHNSKHKDSYKKTLIANNFCSDPKLKCLPVSVRWLFLAMLLECGGNNSATIQYDVGTMRAYLGHGVGVPLALTQLEQYQLVTATKIDLLKGKKEKNSTEENFSVEVGDKVIFKDDEFLCKGISVESGFDPKDGFHKKFLLEKKPDPDSSTANFNARFASDSDQWIEALKSYGAYRLRNKLSTVKARFSTLEELEKWVDHVSNSGKGKELSGQALVSYVAVALTAELGL